MEKTLKDQLHSMYLTYSAINKQFKRIEEETSKLEEDANRLNEERKIVSDILHKTRELEKDVINKLEELSGSTLTPDDILEIIKSYE